MSSRGTEQDGLLHETRYGEGRSPTEATVEALAAAQDIDPTELPSLYDRIDTEAIDQLFSHREEAAETASTVFGFAVDELEVVIQDDGYVRVYDPSQSVDLTSDHLVA